MSKIDFEKELGALTAIRDKCEKFYIKADAAYRSFKPFTDEIVKRIKLVKDKKVYLKKYLKTWFRTFLAVIDECLILLNGEILREHHSLDHKKFIHKRTAEHFYDKKNELSSCSKDGMNFIVRQLEKKNSGHKLDKLTQTLDPLNNKIDALAKNIHKTMESISEALEDIGYKTTFKAKKHKEEFLTASQEGCDTLSFHREDHMIDSKQNALNFVVDDPPQISALLEGNVGTKSRSQGKKRKGAFSDSEDDEEDKPPVKLANSKSEDLPNDAHCNVSIAALKGLYADVDEILAAQSLPPTQSSIHSNNNKIDMQRSNGGQVERQEKGKGEEEEGNINSEQMTKKEGLLESPSMDMQPYSWQGIMPLYHGTTMFQLYHPFPVNPAIRQKGKLTLDIVCLNSLLESEDQYAAYYPCDALFDEIVKRLWLTSECISSTTLFLPSQEPKHTFWFPLQVTANGLPYVEGSMIPLQIDGSKKLMRPIVFEGQEVLQPITQMFYDWIQTTANDSEGAEDDNKDEMEKQVKQYYLYTQYHLLASLCCYQTKNWIKRKKEFPTIPAWSTLQTLCVHSSSQDDTNKQLQETEKAKDMMVLSLSFWRKFWSIFVQEYVGMHNLPRLHLQLEGCMEAHLFWLACQRFDHVIISSSCTFTTSSSSSSSSPLVANGWSALAQGWQDFSTHQTKSPSTATVALRVKSLTIQASVSSDIGLSAGLDFTYLRHPFSSLRNVLERKVFQCQSLDESYTEAVPLFTRQSNNTIVPQQPQAIAWRTALEVLVVAMTNHLDHVNQTAAATAIDTITTTENNSTGFFGRDGWYRFVTTLFSTSKQFEILKFEGYCDSLTSTPVEVLFLLAGIVAGLSVREKQGMLTKRLVLTISKLQAHYPIIEAAFRQLIQIRWAGQFEDGWLIT